MIVLCPGFPHTWEEKVIEDSYMYMTVFCTDSLSLSTSEKGMRLAIRYIDWTSGV